MNRFRKCLTLAAFLLFASPLAYARADDVADFYKGRQITFIVGSDPGGGYDLLGRLVARHLGQFIPGNPGIIIQNMPASGSMAMAISSTIRRPRTGA